MIIICDASPIIALYNIGKLGLLKSVYDEICITDIVHKEVEIPLPDWIKVEKNYNIQVYRSLSLQLDEGEASSISLAVEIGEFVELIIDEKKGRRVAKDLGFSTIGLLGVIVKAKRMDKLQLGMPIIEELKLSGFRISDKIVQIVKDQLEE